MFALHAVEDVSVWSLADEVRPLDMSVSDHAHEVQPR